MRSIHIFRAGTHRAMSGEDFAFAESDLQAVAASYDATQHEAPIVVGHPKTDAPAYGWVASLEAAGDSLYATPHQVDAAFAELVRKGRFKKISAAFYPPNHPAHPGRDKAAYYLRHVGFLGAQAPAVKGLKETSFGDGDDGLVQVELAFAEPGKPATLLPPALLDQLVGDLAEAVKAAAFSEEHESMDDKTLADRQTALEAEAKAQKDREAAFAEQETAFAQERAAFFVDGLISQGRLAPGHKGGMVAFVASLDGDDGGLAFAEEGGKEPKKLSQAAYFKAFLESLPKQITFGEVAGDGAQAEAAGEPEEVARQAVVFREEQAGKGIRISTSEAVRHVTKSKGA